MALARIEPVAGSQASTATTIQIAQPFDELQALAQQTVAAPSARVYGQTYALWERRQ